MTELIQYVVRDHRNIFIDATFDLDAGISLAKQHRGFLFLLCYRLYSEQFIKGYTE